MRFCNVCGYRGNKYQLRSVIPTALAAEWQLTSEEIKRFNRRESLFCPQCHNSARTRALAAAIMKALPFPSVSTFDDWVDHTDRKHLKVAEINSCGQLHVYLKRIHNLSYSEFIPKDRFLKRLENLLKGISHQNIESLSYPDSSFDLVLHSEVLEHVNDPAQALNECRRILKPGGICLFTTPLIRSRQTKQKVRVANGQKQYLSNPSFHGSGESDYLVYWEFGGDIIKKWHAEVVFSNKADELYVLKIKNPS